MSKTIKILALEDKGFLSFHNEWSQTPYIGYKSFLTELAKPHDWAYEIKYLHLTDISSFNEKIREKIYTLQNCSNKIKLSEYLNTFNFLWKSF